MGVSFLEAYSNHTSQVNLNRGFDSVGGMVTNIPTGNPEIDGKAQAKLRVDKTNEAWKGDAGGWSGHPAFSPYVREPFDVVRGLHRGLKLLAGKVGKEKVVAAIEKGTEALSALVESVRGAEGLNEKETDTLTSFTTALQTSLTLHVAQDPAKYTDGLLRFIDMSPPSPPVADIELITVPEDQHTQDKFTYAGLKQYLRLALYYTASFIHGTGCIALDGVFEDLATAEKARVCVWQWLTFDQSVVMPGGEVVVCTPKVVEGAMEEVYAAALGEEREMWGKVCKSVQPMQMDELGEKHFKVAKKVLMILMTNDRCVEFIPDLAYPFLLEPVRGDEGLWEELYEGLDVYKDPMSLYVAGEVEGVGAKVAQP
jgi:malate synthase